MLSLEILPVSYIVFTKALALAEAPSYLFSLNLQYKNTKHQYERNTKY